jgi:hypothetical protein
MDVTDDQVQVNQEGAFFNTYYMRVPWRRATARGRIRFLTPCQVFSGSINFLDMNGLLANNHKSL